MKSKPMVLVVDDDAALLKMASEILKEKYAVSSAISGKEALELISDDYMPDLILLDIEMPELNGFETLDRFREIEDMQDTPIMFVTGVTKTEAQLRGLTCGAVDYVTKPFVKELLLARIAVHLENGKRLRQLSMIEKNNQGERIDEDGFLQFCDDLNETEQKVARLIVLGYDNREISGALSYTYNYIKKVVAVIFEKKGINERTIIKTMFRK